MKIRKDVGVATVTAVLLLVVLRFESSFVMDQKGNLFPMEEKRTAVKCANANQTEPFTTYVREIWYPQDQPIPNAVELPLDDSNVHHCSKLQTREYDTEVKEHVQRFNATPPETWVVERDPSEDYFLSRVSFQIKECPPLYAASTFLVLASTSKARSVGRVGDRYKIQGGCGWYTVSLPIIDQEYDPLIPDECAGKVHLHDDTQESLSTATIELFWTSKYRKHSNQIHDVLSAHTIKVNEFSPEEVEKLLSSSRIEFLERHLDVVSGFPALIELPNIPTDGAVKPRNEAWNFSSPMNPLQLPSCAEIPMAQWPPMGNYNTNLSDTTTEVKERQWPFRGARCYFPRFTREELNQKLAGLRIRLLGDSHMQFVNAHCTPLLCPGYPKSSIFDENYECPIEPNDFVYGWRFYRGILNREGIQDPYYRGSMDGLSNKFRHGDPSSCTQLLGLGNANVTIISTPTWLFVYETNEGLEDYLLTFKNLFDTCRTMFPDLMERHVIIFSSPTAATHFPGGKPGESWRGNQNHRQESFTKLMYEILGPHVDGIIPIFEMTAVRSWITPPHDGTHFGPTTYNETFHLHMSALLSVLEVQRGWKLPLMPPGRNETRWFTGIPIP